MLVFISFKIKNYFSYKDPIPKDLKSFLVYKFTCASCSSSYNGETCRHFKNTIEEHIKKDNKCHIFKHLHSITPCFDSYSCLYFKIIDKANSKFVAVSCCFFSFVFFFNSLSSIVFIIYSLILGTFYCLNYTLLLPHLFTPFNRFYNKYVISTCPRQLL